MQILQSNVWQVKTLRIFLFLFCFYKKSFLFFGILQHISDSRTHSRLSFEMFDCSVCFTMLPTNYFANKLFRTYDDKTLVCKCCGCRFSEPSKLFYHFKSRQGQQRILYIIQSIVDVMGVEKCKCKYCGLMFDDAKVHVQVPHRKC